jgi:hypothetical protein
MISLQVCIESARPRRRRIWPPARDEIALHALDMSRLPDFRQIADQRSVA